MSRMSNLYQELSEAGVSQDNQGLQKYMVEELGISRVQAWRVVNGKRTLSPIAKELLELKLGLHPRFTIHERDKYDSFSDKKRRIKEHP